MAFLWLEPPGHRSIDATALKSLTIRMERTGCFGNCPSYAIMIDGTGIVEYSGRQNVAVVGTKRKMIPPGQVQSLIEDLNSVGFVSLEDRLFEACDDTPKVVVTVSVDKRERTVKSDAQCVGERDGAQARFVASSDTIDRIAGSDCWVKGSGFCSP
jgi:hypothetical protein